MMIHRMLRYGAGWEWHVLQLAAEQTERQSLPSRRAPEGRTKAEPRGPGSEPENGQNERLQSEKQILELKRQIPACGNWLDESRTRRTNHISVDWIEGIGTSLSGTLMIQVSDDETDIQPFHFWMTHKLLITMHHDLRLPLRLQNGTHAPLYGDCAAAPEAFFIMVRVLLEAFHAGLDGFERRLGELEHAMRRSNRTGLLDTIFERRFDLLHWSHLFIPIRELHGAAKEAFIDELEGKESFVRMTHKLERIESLLKHYALEIDTLISMDDAISSFRGNDIMKTLTIFTVLFLPASIAGALWGVNFEWLPWRNQQWGFAVMMAGVAIITLGIYAWLWRKGWTGDLLNKRRRGDLPPDASSRAGRAARHGRSKRGRRDAKLPRALGPVSNSLRSPSGETPAASEDGSDIPGKLKRSRRREM